MEKYSDVVITCSQCGQDFTFTEDEQDFYKSKGFTQPHRCKKCRATKRQQVAIVCSKCGSDLGAKTELFCQACLIGAQLEYEIKAGELQGRLEESISRLASAESEKSRLVGEINEKFNLAQTESARLLEDATARALAIEEENARIREILQQKEQHIVELEWRLNQSNKELEKAISYRVTLDGLEPLLTGLNDRLELLEQNQRSLTRSALQLRNWLNENSNTGGLVEAVKKLFQVGKPMPKHGYPRV